MTKLLTIACTFAVALTLAVSQSNAASTTKTTTHKHTTSAKQGTKKATKPKTTLKTAPGDIVIHVGDLHCVHCAKRISSKLYAVKGVVKVRTDLKADVAIITPQKKKTVDSLALWAAAKKAGFPAMKLVGPSGTYVADAKTKEAKLVQVKTNKTKKASAVKPKASVAPKAKTAVKTAAVKPKS